MDIPFLTLLATILNLEVNIEILKTNKIRNEQGIKQEALLKEIIELLQKMQ